MRLSSAPASMSVTANGVLVGHRELVDFDPAALEVLLRDTTNNE